jgi:hypothetical protein
MVNLTVSGMMSWKKTPGRMEVRGYNNRQNSGGATCSQNVL